MWLLKCNVLFKISLLHFPLFIYLCIYKIIFQIWPNLTDHFCFSGNHEMCCWSKSSVQDSSHLVCQARRGQSRNGKHMVYKWILCYLMRGEEWKFIQLSGMSGLPYWWLNMQHFWWMKIGWKNSLCHLLKGPYGQEAKGVCPGPWGPNLLHYGVTSYTEGHSLPFSQISVLPRVMVASGEGPSGHTRCPRKNILLFSMKPWGRKEKPWQNAAEAEELQDFFQTSWLPAQHPSRDGTHVYVNSC